jgi:hypothetical protein
MTDTDADAPDAPESLPNYLADGLPKQDDDPLRDVQEYVDELLAYRSQAVPADEFSDNAESADDSDDAGRGTVVKERVRHRAASGPSDSCPAPHTRKSPQSCEYRFGIAVEMYTRGSLPVPRPLRSTASSYSSRPSNDTLSAVSFADTRN